jgi:hypothetical protein
MKHTPGPWVAQFDPYAAIDGEWGIGVGGEISNVANCGAKDAHLIAAAPDLLEALVEIIAAADGKGWEQLDPGMGNARAAIKKATGETK